MKYKRRYYPKPFGVMQGMATGMVGLGVTTAVGAGVSSMAPAGSPNMMGGFKAMADMAPIAVTAGIGMSMLPRRKRSRY